MFAFESLIKTDILLTLTCLKHDPALSYDCLYTQKESVNQIIVIINHNYIKILNSDWSSPALI